MGAFDVVETPCIGAIVITKLDVLQTTGIRTVDIAINSFDDGAHPFHLHGHKFFVLAQGHGYPPTEDEVSDYLEKHNLLDNPLRRDVVTVEDRGVKRWWKWLVLGRNQLKNHAYLKDPGH